MRPILVFLILFLSNFVIHSQIKSYNNQEIQILFGSSAQNNINTKQVLVSYGKSFSNKYQSDFKLGYKIDFEFLDEIKKQNIVVVGFGGGFKKTYNLDKINFIFDSYIGMNYIDQNKIGNRNLGENFIFSDNIRLGLEFIDYLIPGLSIFYQFRHISNAGIYNENMGYNSQYIFLSVNLKS